MNTFFAVIGIGVGLYCLYAYVMMKTKKQITNSIFLPQELRIKKCKDIDGYIKMTSVPLLLLGIGTLIYGILEAINEYVTNLGNIPLIGSMVVLVLIFIFAYVTRKANQKYFGL